MNIHLTKSQSRVTFYVLLILCLLLVYALPVRAADTSPPTANMTATDAGTCGNAVSWYPRIVGTALDNVNDDTGVTRVEFYIDDELIGTNTKITYRDLYGISKECSDIPNGKHYLTAKLYDASGNVGLATTYSGYNRLTFTVNNDKQSPTGELFIYNNSDGTYGANVINVSDNNEVIKLDYYIDGNLYYTTTPNLKMIILEGLESGEHIAMAKLYDEAGNEGYATTQNGTNEITFTVEGTNTDNNTNDNGDRLCKAEEDIAAITNRIYTRADANVTSTDEIVNKIMAYIMKSKGNIDLSGKFDDISNKSTATDIALIELAEKTNFSCGESVQNQIEKLKNATINYQNAVKEYRQSVLELIKYAKGESN